MPARVTLTMIGGESALKEYVFEERTTCIIGRAKDCRPIRVPQDDAHGLISRHHCLLDINPPDVRVRDFGSRNGTYVNGKLIGKRTTVTPDATANFPEHDLKDGDEIRLQRTVFRVQIYQPELCSHCGGEISELETNPLATSGDPRACKRCQSTGVWNAYAEPNPDAKKGPHPALSHKGRGERRCAACGGDVSGLIDERRKGAMLCAGCQQNPAELARHLLDLANTGEASLEPIQGYRIVQELGRGGMGAVYLARHIRTGEQVALKVMLPRVAVDRRAQERFLRETVNTQALRHPHVVQLLDSGCSQGTFFFTLEFCDGGSVDKLMKERGGRLAVEEALPLMLQVLDGLAYAHQAEIPHVKLGDGSIGQGRGLVHRDLKPPNILLSGSGGARIAKVGDYGLSKAFDTAGFSGLTATGTTAGTPFFMPRQQVLDFLAAKPEVDVWAAAASFYNMLTDCVPRDFPRETDPWLTVLSTSAVPIRQRLASIPPRLAEVIDQALIDKPAIQVRSARELKRLLEAAV